MGGHVEACTDCGHWRIAYNSCRNRHCPKCQGAAARTWLAAREADLLPVGYFHVVFTLPAEIAAIAFHNKALLYGLLFKTASETTLTIAAGEQIVTALDINRNGQIDIDTDRIASNASSIVSAHGTTVLRRETWQYSSEGSTLHISQPAACGPTH
jgi:hypothetical protein